MNGYIGYPGHQIFFAPEKKENLWQAGKKGIFTGLLLFYAFDVLKNIFLCQEKNFIKIITTISPISVYIGDVAAGFIYGISRTKLTHAQSVVVFYAVYNYVKNTVNKEICRPYYDNAGLAKITVIDSITVSSIVLLFDDDKIGQVLEEMGVNCFFGNPEFTRQFIYYFVLLLYFFAKAEYGIGYPAEENQTNVLPGE